MRISSQCYDCLRNLAGQASGSATEDCSLREQARLEGEKALKHKFQPGEVSIVIASAIHDAVRGETGNPDPYREMKDIEVEAARQLFTSVRGEFGDDFPGLLKLAVRCE